MTASWRFCRCRNQPPSGFLCNLMRGELEGAPSPPRFGPGIAPKSHRGGYCNVCDTRRSFGESRVLWIFALDCCAGQRDRYTARVYLCRHELIAFELNEPALVNPVVRPREKFNVNCSARLQACILRCATMPAWHHTLRGRNNERPVVYFLTRNRPAVEAAAIFGALWRV